MIYGVVQDESMQPVEGAIVYIVKGTGTHTDIAALTDVSGRYQLSGMAPGKYELSARHTDYVVSTVEIETGTRDLELNFALKKFVEGEPK